MRIVKKKKRGGESSKWEKKRPEWEKIKNIKRKRKKKGKKKKEN